MTRIATAPLTMLIKKLMGNLKQESGERTQIAGAYNQLDVQAPITTLVLRNKDGDNSRTISILLRAASVGSVFCGNISDQYRV